MRRMAWSTVCGALLASGGCQPSSGAVDGSDDVQGADDRGASEDSSGAPESEDTSASTEGTTSGTASGSSSEPPTSTSVATSTTSTTTVADGDETSDTTDTLEEPPITGTPDPNPDEDTDNETLVHLSVKFYGAQRSGEGPNWLLDGETCHVGDGESIDADLSGGWHDAGDHVKPTLSNAFASYVVLKAFEVYGTSFADRDDTVYSGAPNAIPDVLDEVRYATDYLVKAHLSTDELVGMVGATMSDHSTWSTCVVQQTQSAATGGAPRPVSMDANADIAGITAGALALMAKLIRPYDSALADTYLEHAIEIYEIGKANPVGSNPGLYGQDDDAWYDEMLCGAVELYRATGEDGYRDDALDFNDRRASHFWAPNWGEVADFCRHSLYLAGETDAALEYWSEDIANYGARMSDAEYVDGIIFFDNWGSLRYAANAAFSAALHYEVTGESSSRDLALSQLDYIKGANEYDRSFVVGFGNNPPQQPHHRNAHGKNDIDEEGFVHVLAGALVGGPTRTMVQTSPAGYVDDVHDYIGNEVALDYNAGFVGLAAFGVEQERR